MEAIQWTHVSLIILIILRMRLLILGMGKHTEEDEMLVIPGFYVRVQEPNFYRVFSLVDFLVSKNFKILRI